MNKMNIPFTIESSKLLGLEDLLPRIPENIILKTLQRQVLTNDEAELIQKIDCASENAMTPLPLGIAAIGELLAYSADKVTPEAVENIGWLIESLGRQMFALSNLKDMSESTLATDKGLKAGNGGLMS